MKEEWVGQNYMSNKGSRLKSPAHICRKCLIAFRRVLQWVTSVSKSFSHSAANYVSRSEGSRHPVVLSTIPSSCETYTNMLNWILLMQCGEQNVSCITSTNTPTPSTLNTPPRNCNKAVRLIPYGRPCARTTMHIHTAPLNAVDV